MPDLRFNLLLYYVILFRSGFGSIESASAQIVRLLA